MKQISHMGALRLSSAVLALGAFGSPALAQDSDGARSSDDVIIVTAQRRAQDVLDVPLAIQAISGEGLQDAGIRQISDLTFTTPGYNVSDSNGYTQIFIRGVGNAIFVGADPSVATFIDDVPRIYGSMVNNFVNVERVEVLKGAQGGLYGRNATGGVVNIITRQPSTDEVNMSFRLTLAEHQTVQAAGYVNLPLGQKAALSLSGERRVADPYIKNVAPDNPYTAAMFPFGAYRFGAGGAIVPLSPSEAADFFNSGVKTPNVSNQDFWAVDGKLLLEPTDNIKVTLAGDYSNKDDSQGNSQFNVTPEYTQAFALEGSFGNFGIPVNLPDGIVIGNPKKFQVAAGNPGFVRLEDYGFSGTVVVSLDNMDLTSISAYRNQHTEFLEDLNASSVPITAAFVNNHKHFFYQELRAASAFEGPLQFIAGATYLDSSFRGATDVDILTPLASFPVARATTKVKNWSVYAQATYDLTEKLSATVSGRYIHEKNDSYFTFSDTSIGASEEKFLPSATLSYKLDTGNVYARWARGFKSGGVNPVADPNAFLGRLNEGSVFKGETVDTYEAGVRTALFDRSLQFTAAAFYNDYKNLHVAGHARAQYAATVILAIINAGTARTYGAEAGLTWHAADPITIGVNVGYLNAKYKTFKLENAVILDDFDHSGERMNNAPEWQANFTIDFDQPISNDLRLVANGLLTHSSSVLWQFSGDPANIPDAAEDGYWLANARIGLKTTDNQFGIAVFANNLFNTPYTTFGNSGAGTATQLNWGNPRIIGVELTADF